MVWFCFHRLCRFDTSNLAAIDFVLHRHSLILSTVLVRMVLSGNPRKQSRLQGVIA